MNTLTIDVTEQEILAPNEPNNQPNLPNGNAADVRWAVNVLLEKIAESFEGWETMDLWRSEAAATVRSFKHDLTKSPYPIPSRDRSRGVYGVVDGERSQEELAEIAPSKLTTPMSVAERRALKNKVLDFIGENQGIFDGRFNEYELIRIIEVFEEPNAALSRC